MRKTIKIYDEQHKKIAGHYSKFVELSKLKEELNELELETNIATRCVPTKPPENMWSEMADVINCIIHVAMQWDKVDDVLAEIDRKLNRQMERMGNE